MRVHIPVLLNEVLKWLAPQKGEFFIDGTVNGGGHAFEILKFLGKEGRFLGLDWDNDLLKKLKKRIALLKKQQEALPEIILLNANYADLKEILAKKNLGKADCLLLDLGFSSEQLENSGRGFGFLKDEPLILTYHPSKKPVFQWLSELNVKQLALIIRNFGEERNAFKIAKAIKQNLPILTSKVLSEVIEKAVSKSNPKKRIHPATKTFQALRIFANEELLNLEKVLDSLEEIVRPNGRVGIISFHSLEDRLVKRKFLELKRLKKAEVLTKKPIRPSSEEIKNNFRSRSAKLRVLKIL